ncbi:hypothetical protein GGU11DRAFT_166535 [Lentinula aff. detonsa]|nr:hypothetical protein GGU11DRAFT_166535 [Lentinula aff. detonsa]
MRKYDLQSATRIFTRFRSTFDNGGSNEKALSLTSKDPLNSPVSTRTAAYTSVPRSLLPTVIGVLAGPEAGGIPPFASVYPSSRQDRARVRTAHRCRKFDSLQESSPPSPQDLWTRALTLASKDVKSITSKMLVHFFQRGKANYRPWSPTMSNPNHSAASSDSSAAAPGSPDSDHPILDHPIRLTLSHYTTLIHGLLLRRHYPVALSWARNLVYPFPNPPTYTSSRLKDLSRTFNHLKYSRNSVHLYLDGPALSACLVVLARLGRVHEAIAVLEAYASPSFRASPARSARHADARHVQLNSIQMDDFLLTLLRWPSKKHALPVPSVDVPLPLKPTRSNSRPATLHKLTKKIRKTLIEDSSLPTQATAATRSARPDLLLRLLPALYSRYGVAWDARTVCLMLQAVRMGAKMDSVSAFGLRKVISDLFGRNMKSNRKLMSLEGSSKMGLMMEETSKLNSVSRHDLLVEKIMEVLWETVDAENTTSSSLSKPFLNKTDKKIKKNASPAHTPRQSSLSPLEYIPFRPWPVPVSFSPSSDPSSSGLSMLQSILPGSELSTYSRLTTPTHPFLLAREIFLRLIWEHAETLNRRENLDINLHAISSPAILPKPSLARLFDPDGDGLGHLGGLPKWFGVLEDTLKRKLGFGLELLKIPSTTTPSSLNTGDSEVMSTNLRMKLVDEVFGYPKNPRSPSLPKLTSIAFHHYILLLGLSAPEPREFIKAGWDQRYPFEGYPQPMVSTHTSTYVNRSAFPLSSSTGPFTGGTASNLKTAQGLISSSTLIPGVLEIPISLFYMRALRIVPTKDTLCAAVVFWREAVGGESLIELGVKEYNMSRMKLKDDQEEDNPSSSSRDVEDAYAKEYEMWKASKEPPQSEAVELGEYAKFCRWIREWVDEINTGKGTMRDKTMMTMPHPYHIHRWAGIIRKMREGQGYDDDEKESKGFEGKEEDVDEN